MTGLNGQRVYLDWNATAPLRPEARAAMLEAMDVVGNPSSVHAEGRAAKKIIEKARGQVAALVGCEPSEVVFTSGATEAAAMILAGEPVHCSGTEHDCIEVHRKGGVKFPVDSSGRIASLDPNGTHFTDLAEDLDYAFRKGSPHGHVACATASGETGVIQDVGEIGARLNGGHCFKSFTDLTQSAGKDDVNFDTMEIYYAALSSHKLGGPKGVGALIHRGMVDVPQAMIEGGGQEQGRRSGTENVIGIAGFGAAAEAADRDLDDGVWEPIEKLRNILEERLAAAAPETIFFGRTSPRLPNTSCFAVPGWKGETQVMQMDLSGFAVSAGSACSSGKVNKASRVLMAMGFDEITASSAIRVSMGPTTTEAEVMAFADTWIEHYRRRKARAA